jgi:hypothetical protein
MQNFIIKSFFVTLFCLTLGMAKAQFTTDQWNWSGSSTAQWWDYSSTMYRAGSISIFGYYASIPENQGFLFYDGGGNVGPWGGFHHYGLSLGKFKNNSNPTNASANFSMFETGDNTPNQRSLILSGYAGLGLRSQNAAMILHQSGVISIGFNADHWMHKIRSLSVLTSEHGDLHSGYQLYVRQGIVTEKVKVANVANWPDYVFQKDYPLLPLSKVEAHIKEKGHLPNVPAAAVIEKEGVELGDMTKRQQEKIEELFLHLIALEKRVQALEAENAALKQPISTTNK